MAAGGAFIHVRNYASAGMLASLAGIISFPILTRNLSVEEYGILGLITASLTLIIAVGKLGLQHAVIRFFSQVKNANIAFSIGQLNSTVSALFLLLATITTLVWLLLGIVILPDYLQYENISELFVVSALTVFVRLLGSGIMNFLRAQQRSAVVGFSQVLNRYLYLALVLGLLFVGGLNPYFVLLCMVLAEVVGVGFAAAKYWPDFSFRLQELSRPLGKAMLVYGIPLMMLESLGLVLRLSDRYLIEAMLGQNALGMYSASYNLTAYLDIVLLTAMVQALKPHYMHLWESDGKAQTSSFLSKGLHAYLVVGVPVLALFSLLAPHLLNFLASPKYAPGTVIIPFVAFSFLLEGAMHFLAAGLYIHKNTRVLMLWGVLATVLNLVLNLLLIPVFGILGAAFVTIVSYLVFTVGVSVQAFRYLSFPVPVLVPFAVTLLGLTVYGLLFRLDVAGDLANLLLKGTLAGILLLAGVLVLDNTARTWVFARLHRGKAT